MPPAPADPRLPRVEGGEAIGEALEVAGRPCSGDRPAEKPRLWEPAHDHQPADGRPRPPMAKPSCPRVSARRQIDARRQPPVDRDSPGRRPAARQRAVVEERERTAF